MVRRIHLAEAAVAAFGIAAASLFLWDSRQYTASPFEPIGSGAVPAGTAAIALALSSLMLASSVRGFRAARQSPSPPELTLRVLATFLLTVIYTGVLATGAIRYAYATAAFVALGVAVIAERPRNLALWTAALALVLGAGLDFLFRTVFVTNIP